MPRRIADRNGFAVLGEAARRRDYDEKLADYAVAKVAEYWIVDPEKRIVTVHKLQGEKYAVHGEFAEGAEATSVLLDGFEVNVAELFAVIDDIPD